MPILFLFQSSRGWETRGAILSRPFYEQGQALILMFDLTARCTYKNLGNWHRDFLAQQVPRTRIPTVVCGNKSDIPDRKVQRNQITYPRKKRLPYYDISAKSYHNIQKPFLCLARQLLGDDNLQFVTLHSLANLCRKVVLSNLPSNDKIINILITSYCLDEDYMLQACLMTIKRNEMRNDPNLEDGFDELGMLYPGLLELVEEYCDQEDDDDDDYRVMYHEGGVVLHDGVGDV